MNILVVYSSRTGNTKKIAQAIQCALPENVTLRNVEEEPNFSECDLVFIGYWVDKGIADSKAQKFMKQICNKHIALFGTLGAYPESDHAKDCIERTEQLLSSCTVVDHFLCQGAIDPKLIQWMKTLPKDDPHGPNKSSLKRWHDAATHPDEQDYANVSKWALNVLKKVDAIVSGV